MNLASLIDHTLLKPDATVSMVERLCAEAAEYNFFSVCVNPIWVPFAAELLQPIIILHGIEIIMYSKKNYN